MCNIKSYLLAIFIVATGLAQAQTVVGYSQSVPIEIRPQGTITAVSSPATIHIGATGNTISALSIPVAIDIPESVIHQRPKKGKPKANLSGQVDVNINIPSTNISSPNTLVLIIGNEDYASKQTSLESEVNVDFAADDARILKQYMIKTLGVPERNIQLLINAGLVDMKRAINKLKLLIKNYNGQANVIVYYAGHGLPHEATREPYLIPVDVSANDLNMAIKLNDLYSDLTAFPSQKVVVFLDACFSGGAREQGLLAARGVKIKPREQQTQGKLVVFAATSGNQSALPYKEKQHGLFTYYLLKALQDNNGQINLGELSEYLIKEVGIQSLMINSREQNPAVNKSPAVKNDWYDWMLY
ncbi:MAG: caspase family protein [Salinivirgaceae bacterium]